MQVILAEKEEAGRKIAEALSPHPVELHEVVTVNNKSYRFTYWECGNVIVVPAHGHLFATWPKGITTAKLEDLPILDWYWKPESAQAKARFDFIKKIIKEYGITENEFIIATDWDREGEVIGYAIFIHLFKTNKLPQNRMYFSSLMASDVQYAYRNLRSMNEKLLTQGLARNIADAIIGLNITKALTRRFKEIYPELIQAMSMGRVQSPVLLYVVERLHQKIEKVENRREEEITDYVTILKISSRGKTYYYRSFFGLERLKPPLQAKLETRTRAVQRPELLKNTDEIVTSISGLKPSKVMEIMERLYLKGWMTYPRTESNWVPLEMLKKIEETLRYYIDLPSSFKAENSPSIDEYYAREGKTAIVLTPDGIHAYFNDEMDELEKIVASYIIDTILSSIRSKLEVEETQLVIIDSEGRIETISWQTKVLFNSSDVYDYVTLETYPELDPQDISVEIIKYPITRKELRFTPLYRIEKPSLTEADLVNWMQWKDLGTDATRPTYPELLKQRKYLYEELYPTLLGKKIAEIIREIGITVELTSEMEREIGRIARFEDIDRFKSEWIDTYTVRFVEKIKSIPEDKLYFRCSRCGEILELRQYTKSKRIYGICRRCDRKYAIV